LNFSFKFFVKPFLLERWEEFSFILIHIYTRNNYSIILYKQYVPSDEDISGMRNSMKEIKHELEIF